MGAQSKKNFSTGKRTWQWKWRVVRLELLALVTMLMKVSVSTESPHFLNFHFLYCATVADSCCYYPPLFQCCTIKWKMKFLKYRVYENRKSKDRWRMECTMIQIRIKRVYFLLIWSPERFKTYFLYCHLDHCTAVLKTFITCLHVTSSDW